MISTLRVLSGVLAGVLFLALVVLYLRAARRYGKYMQERYPDEVARLRKRLWGRSPLWLGMLPMVTLWDLELRLDDDELGRLRRKIICLFAWGVPAIWILVAISCLVSWLR
jgi:hypothetical protein